MPLDIIIDDLKGEDQRIVPLYMDVYAIIWDTIETLSDFKISKRILLDYYSNAEVYLNELEEFLNEVIRLKTIFASSESTTVKEFITDMEKLIYYAIEQKKMIKLLAD